MLAFYLYEVNAMKYMDRDILTAEELMKKLRFSSRSSFDEFCSDDRVGFPKPVRIGIRRKGWFTDEVEVWFKRRDEDRRPDAEGELPSV